MWYNFTHGGNLQWSGIISGYNIPNVGIGTYNSSSANRTLGLH